MAPKANPLRLIKALRDRKKGRITKNLQSRGPSVWTSATGRRYVRLRTGVKTKNR
jgi:hypothetical protein